MVVVEERIEIRKVLAMLVVFLKISLFDGFSTIKAAPATLEPRTMLALGYLVRS